MVGVSRGGLPAVVKQLENAALIGVPMAGAMACPFYFAAHRLGWIELSAFIVSYLFVGLGVGIGLHRFFTHRSFVAAPWLGFCLGVAGSMAFQGSVLRWVCDHRRHHSHTDRLGDPHSPHVGADGRRLGTVRGLLHAHIGWMLDPYVTDPAIFGKDLSGDRLVMFFHRTHWAWPVLSLLLPWLWGYWLGGPATAWGCLLFAGCLRTFLVHHLVWAVNSIGHRYGEQPSTEANQSRNNTLLGVIAFGDGWHNNHHRFPRSAMHGLAPRELDLSGLIIRYWERRGWVHDVQRAPASPQG